ncbi:uncharacterized protein LOC111401018 [Olea europaea var. sylvestris]|uniref:uncharacterized protein LOC111401018 n=1 Tax=Olea europaea var. sylvestris TaxID=158386 RepID=UPI000C1D0696|nr:uncharacterized protein LOC111401018 [Olea europaea var. sylvestris]
MKYLSGVGLGLSLVFGCLLLALLFEIYYLLWWKNRIIKRSNENGHYNRSATKFFSKFCCKKPSSSSTTGAQEISVSETISQTPQAHEFHGNSNDNKNLQFNPFGSEDSIPRFLYSIEEETRSDLESENGGSSFDISRKQSRSKSLSDLFHNIAETPFLTPVTSPPYFTPPLTPSSSSDNHNQKGCFNPFHESESDAAFNKLRSSPPPNLKFLRDAEDKLYSRKIMEEERPSQNYSIEEQYCPSSCSLQVLPMNFSHPNCNSKLNS